MDLFSDYITPVELTGYVRPQLADYEQNAFTLSRYLPSETINDLDYRFTRGGEGLTEAATFRSYDTEAPVANRPGVTRVTGELPPISRKIRLGEYNRLRQRNLDAEARNAILDDAVRMTRAIGARAELARGDALVNGSVTINENGVQATVSFGRDSSMSKTPQTSTWDGTADPIDDMLVWRDSYVALNGSEPGVIVTSRKVLSALMRNDNIAKAAFPNAANVPNVINQSVVNQVLNSFGLPSIELYDAQVRVNGSAQRVIDDAKVLFLPAVGSQDADQVGKTLWGVTAESLEPEFADAGAGIVAGAYSTKDPVAVWTKASAIMLPVLANPNLVMVADVL